MQTLRLGYGVYKAFMNQCYFDANCTDGKPGFIVDFNKDLEKALNITIKVVKATTFDTGSLINGSDFLMLKNGNRKKSQSM